jgi:hypothetical protein
MNAQMGGVNTRSVELYEDERGTSNYGPPPGWKPKTQEVQHTALRELWPQLEAPPSIEALLAPYMVAGEPKGYCDNGSPSVVLPEGAEGFFFAAKFSSILRLVKGDQGLPDYNRVLKHLFAMLGERRPNFKDLTDGRLDGTYERPLEAWWKRRLAYEATIQGDFIAYAGQTGIMHRNWSVRAFRAYMEQMQSWLGMTSPDAAQVLLVHPERLTKNGHLSMDCAGSERAPEAGGDFCRASCFHFSGGKLGFDSCGVRGRYPNFGSASVCLPGVPVLNP